MTANRPHEDDWLWNGGQPIDDPDLYRKQQIEDEIADY